MDNEIQEKKAALQIKGIKEGLLISFGEGTREEIVSNLLEHIQAQAGFFNGARIALDVGKTVMYAADMGALRDQLSEFGVTLWAMISSSPTTEATAQNLGLATRISAPRAERVIRTMDNAVGGEKAMLVHKTMRSGFKTSYDGHVIVIGDVNPGAEIVASGNIVVWGRLKGMVHAGSEGNDNAVVCALEMQPTLLRIAEVIAQPPTTKGGGYPATAYILNGQVVVDAWSIERKEYGS